MKESRREGVQTVEEGCVLAHLGGEGGGEDIAVQRATNGGRCFRFVEI